MAFLLEVCIDSNRSAIAANEGKADRIELCSALSVGGLTPSLGLYATVRDICTRSSSSCPIMVMIRPRLGDFCYSSGELETMLNDIKAFVREMKDRPEDGFVFGCLFTDGSIDADSSRQLLAVDCTPDPVSAVSLIRSLGFRRVLTSGGAQNSMDGAVTIARMREAAESPSPLPPLIVMPGGGVTSANLQALMSSTGAREFHASASVPDEPFRGPRTPAAAAFDFGPQRVTSAALVRQLKEILHSTHSS